MSVFILTVDTLRTRIDDVDEVGEIDDRLLNDWLSTTSIYRIGVRKEEDVGFPSKSFLVRLSCCIFADIIIERNDEHVALDRGTIECYSNVNDLDDVFPGNDIKMDVLSLCILS